MNQAPRIAEPARPIEFDLPIRIAGAVAAKTRRLWKKRFAAILAIGLPLLAAAIYCFILAAPIFSSNVRFIIRGNTEGASTALGKLLPGAAAGAASAFTDGFAVRDYISSYDALQKLDKNVGFVERLKHPRGDLIYRLRGDESREQLLDFYRRMVQVRYNLTEAIVNIDVHAFTPQDAHAIATELMRLAEDFSNQLNRRATEDTLRLSNEEVKAAEERLANARSAFNNWRKDNANLDLEANAKVITQIVGQLEVKQIEARTELGQIVSSSPNNPRRKFLEEMIQSLQTQIDTERSRLTGANTGGSIVNLMIEYQKLNMNQEFASKTYELALQSLHNARALANSKQKYVAPIANPMLPEQAAHPASVKIMALTLICSLFAFWLVTLTYSVIRESRGA